MSPIDGLDFAVVSPCPDCGRATRRFATVPTRGPWWCRWCLSAKIAEAVDTIRAVDEVEL